MRLSLFPTYGCRSTYNIPFERLCAEGVSGVIFDIDNTLVEHNAPADERSKALFERLRSAGMRTCIISNNKKPRVSSFADAVGSPYIYDAGKPGSRGYLAAVRAMGIDPKNAVFVGDQIFTDILGANMAGIKNILVDPIGGEIKLSIKLKRIFEVPVRGLYRLLHKEKYLD